MESLIRGTELIKGRVPNQAASQAQGRVLAQAASAVDPLRLAGDPPRAEGAAAPVEAEDTSHPSRTSTVACPTRDQSQREVGLHPPESRDHRHLTREVLQEE